MRREAEDTTDVADTDLIIDNIVVVDEDVSEEVNEYEDEGLDNTEVNCHKCLKASFSFKKVINFVYFVKIEECMSTLHLFSAALSDLL